MLRKYLKQKLAKQQTCCEDVGCICTPISGPSDTVLRAPKSDSFAHLVRI